MVVKNYYGITPEEAMQLSGGMGRFQWFTLAIGILCFSSTGYYYYNLSYLELFPKYTNYNKVEVFPFFCYTSKQDKIGYGCLQEDACKLKSPAYFEANEKAENFIHNWAAKDKLNLYCTDGGLIGLIGSMYFAGAFTSLLFLPAISDKKGRKWIAFFVTVMQFIIYIYFYFTTSLTSVIVCMFFVGFGSTGSASLLYLYIAALIPEGYRNLYASL